MSNQGTSSLLDVRTIDCTTRAVRDGNYPTKEETTQGYTWIGILEEFQYDEEEHTEHTTMHFHFSFYNQVTGGPYWGPYPSLDEAHKRAIEILDTAEKLTEQELDYAEQFTDCHPLDLVDKVSYLYNKYNDRLQRMRQTIPTTQ